MTQLAHVDQMTHAERVFEREGSAPDVLDVDDPAVRACAPPVPVWVDLAALTQQRERGRSNSRRGGVFVGGTVLVVVALLWGLSGWRWTVPALALGVAVAVALVARVVGVLLPREGRWIANRAGVLAGTVALAFLLSQSSGWAVLLTLGIVALVLALPQSRPARRLVGAAGAVLVLVGAAGLVVQGIAERADRAAAYQAAGDITRGQLLPDTPEEALIALMDAVARPDHAGCYLFTDVGRAALTAAYSAPDCLAALRAAGASVDDPDAYARRVDRASLDVQLDLNAASARPSTGAPSDGDRISMNCSTGAGPGLPIPDLPSPASPPCRSTTAPDGPSTASRLAPDLQRSGTSPQVSTGAADLADLMDLPPHNRLHMFSTRVTLRVEGP